MSLYSFRYIKLRRALAAPAPRLEDSLLAPW
jgi:hypothetical protein